MTDNGDCTYTATLTSPTTVGGATVTGTAQRLRLAATTSVTYVAAATVSVRAAAGPSPATLTRFTATIQAAQQHGHERQLEESCRLRELASPHGRRLGNACTSDGIATRTSTTTSPDQINLDTQVTGPRRRDLLHDRGRAYRRRYRWTIIAVPPPHCATARPRQSRSLLHRRGNRISRKTVTLAQGARLDHGGGA